MACCPFHDDKNPSMKVDQRFHCFGCGEDGDVIDFTAKLFDLSLLLDDFMSELDAKRRKNFLNNIGDTQVIITCTDEIKDEFDSKSVFYVNNGVIKKELD